MTVTHCAECLSPDPRAERPGPWHAKSCTDWDPSHRAGPLDDPYAVLWDDWDDMIDDTSQPLSTPQEPPERVVTDIDPSRYL